MGIIDLGRIGGGLALQVDEQYRSTGGLKQVPPHVDDTGEVNWLVSDALQMEVPVPVIAQSVMQLLQSRDGLSNAARAIALMRQGFGGHPLGHAARVAEKRRTGRVGDIVFLDGADHHPHGSS